MLQKNIHSGNKTVLKDVIPLNQPLCVSIEPTNTCNFKCAMCYHGNNESDPKAGPLKNMEMEVFEKTLEDLKSLVRETGERIKLIKLYSLGEPLLNPNICKMVKEIKETNVCEKIEITTNGSLLSKETAEKLVDYGLDILRLSVYSVEKERLHKVTRSNFDPKVIRENLEYLKQYRNAVKKDKPEIFAKMLDANSEENEIFLEEYSKIADHTGIDEVFQISLGEGNDAFERMYSKNAEAAHKKSLDSNTVSSDERRPCRYPFTHLTIRNDGTVIVCCADWLKELSIGNIMDHSLKEYWESKSMYEIRCAMLKTKGLKWTACRSCEIPYRDSEEDDVSQVDTNTLAFENEL